MTAKKTTTKKTINLAKKKTKKPSKAFKTIKAGLDDAIAYARGDKSRGKMTKIPTQSILAGFQYEIETDSNYPDNSNLTFIKPGNVAFTKEETKAITTLAEKMGLDPEPIMEGMYSFDALTKELIVRELGLAGLTEYVSTDTYVPDFSDPIEPEDPNNPNAAGGCAGGCSVGSGSGCGGVVGYTDPSAASTNPADYYFHAQNDPTTGDDYYSITPRAYYDTTQALYGDDMAIESMLETNDFFRLAESCFEFGGGNLQAGRALLLSLGFIENMAL
jgi:hypothetical protein